MHLDNIYEVPTRDIRKWAMFCHLGGVARITWIPFAAVIVPLIVWLAKRDEHPYIDEHGKEAVNFQLSMALYNFVLGIVIGILSFFLFRWLFLPLFALIWLAQVGGAVYGGLKALEGEPFRYPFTIRFLN